MLVNLSEVFSVESQSRRDYDHCKDKVKLQCDVAFFGESDCARQGCTNKESHSELGVKGFHPRTSVFLHVEGWLLEEHVYRSRDDKENSHNCIESRSIAGKRSRFTLEEVLVEDTTAQSDHSKHMR